MQAEDFHFDSGIIVWIPFATSIQFGKFQRKIRRHSEQFISMAFANFQSNLCIDGTYANFYYCAHIQCLALM